VNGIARGVRLVASHGLKYAQSGFVQSYLLWVSIGAIAVLAYLIHSSGA
jgi:hypothetical protein